MEINRAAFGALAVFGIVAAGGGAYLANRHNDATMPSTATYSAPTESAVTETENSIATPAVAVQPEPFVAEERTPAPARPAAVARPVSPKQAAKADRAPAQVRSTPPASQRPRASSSTNTSASPTQAPSVSPVESPVSAPFEPLENTTVERGPVVQEPARKLYDELVIPADSVIGLQVETAVTTERAKVEDAVRARVTRDVRVRDQVAIPAGARAEGSVTLVERGGRLKDQARLGIRFHTIVLADGTRLPINTETIYRDGESPARESAAKIGGGAVGGAVLGAIFGGKKGAIIGSTVGAAGGGVAVAASEANAATLAQGSTVTVRMGSPATVTVER
jgi:hypothetical protein